LQARGIRFDILSRGYGRKTRGVLVVDPNGSASDFGDEPLLIARRLGVPVIVGESRCEAGQLAETKFTPQLHILDDGFQHRSLARHFDIVLLTEYYFEDRLLPSGRLREPLSSLARADAIVLPAESAAGHAAFGGKLIWRMQRSIAVPEATAAPVVFCGIARPEQFFAQVRATGIRPAFEVAFRDHHSFSPRDVEQLLAMRAKHSASGFVTTEKDAFNLGALKAELNPLAIVVLTVTLDNPTDIVDTILSRIKV